ncbi:MAG TPA: hypothetical protein VEK74_06890 [Burkholderiaceae bacterium]|nr:hypothetical protein [Burkholderiaceae bacterium]
MTTEVSPTRLSVQRDTFVQRDAVKYLSDRVVLTAVFITLFYLNYASSLIDAFANIFAVDNDLARSRTVSGAEILGFVAIFVVLRDLRTERVLRWWDFVAIVGIVTASLYPSEVCRAISMTCLGLFFIARSDKRIGSLGQLCIGVAWIGFWGALVLSFIKPWLLPIEAGFAFLPLSLFGSFSLEGTIISNGNGHAIDVLEPCSAFRNTVTTAFIWLSMIKIQKLDFQSKYLYILVIGVVTVVMLNTVRISIMAVSESQYFFWHTGPGLWIVKALMLSGILGLFYFGFRTPVAFQPRE